MPSNICRMLNDFLKRRKGCLPVKEDYARRDRVQNTVPSCIHDNRMLAERAFYCFSKKEEQYA
ncbi:MAG: hypothetical protein EGR91_10935 [Lachnospiraceae bacterium]|nr:hypothetical protein [Lachnospiraceae bacterium]